MHLRLISETGFEFPCAADEIGVHVRFKNVPDPQPIRLGKLQKVLSSDRPPHTHESFHLRRDKTQLRVRAGNADGKSWSVG
jgi:hypothetical protein